MGELENGFSSQIAIIPKGTVINGNIQMSGSLEMYGSIHGDIQSDSRVHLCGEVEGNISVNELDAKDSYVEGTISCQSNVYIRENTVVLGDISSNNLEIDGAIKGNLDVKGNITVGSQAIVESDIKAKTIQVTNGAALNGHCSLCYADIDMDALFPKQAKAQIVNGTDKLQHKTKRNVS